jgi:hypothetical protein
MRRTFSAFVAILVLVLLWAAIATGGKPIREPLFSEGFDLPNVCDFPVAIEITANKEFVTFFDDGRIHVTGKLFATVTNAESGESLDINISGPALISPESERGGGRLLLILFEEDVEGPGLLLTTGRVDIIRGEDGFIDEFTVRGGRTDLCAALGG